MAGNPAPLSQRTRVARALGAEVRASRRRLGLSTRAAARHLGLSTRFLNELERGKATVRLDKVVDALDGLGLELAVRLRDGPDATGARLREAVEARLPQLRAIAGRHGVKGLWLFGSAARGEARADSDLDFVAELDRSRSLLDLAGLKQDLEALFARRVDVFTRSTLKRGVLAGALADQIRIL